MRPVKGQILRLRDPAGPGLLSRVVRFEGGYLVPRADGCYVLGATVEEQGFDLSPTAGGVYELLRDACELVPGIDELRIEELSVGLRPGTPDNAPVIGRGALDGTRVGDRPPPQRHPARAAHRRARARDALRPNRPTRSPRPAARIAFRRCPHDPQRRALGDPRRGDRRRRARTARPATGRAGRRRGGRRRGRAARRAGRRSRSPQDARVEVLTAMQGG